MASIIKMYRIYFIGRIPVEHTMRENINEPMLYVANMTWQLHSLFSIRLSFYFSNCIQKRSHCISMLGFCLEISTYKGLQLH